ncbi:MAG: flavin reductase family protein [Marinisporobacter sp.]|nr:flavin reductase family protein [Marinisporobacter sp.]
MKKSVEANTYIFPLPSVVVGTYDNENKPNMMTASWTGIVNSNPTMVSVSLRKATYSYNNLIDKKAFTISIPSKKHILEMDYVGTKSGKREDKFKKTGLNPVKSGLVDAPYVSEFPVVLECKLIKYDELGLHTMFIGEVIDVKIDEEYLNENGMPNMSKIDPIAYAHGGREYYEIGAYLGRANFMWQISLLNDTITSDGKKEIVEFILNYYNKLDNGEPIEEFKNFFNWNDFEIMNGNNFIDSFEKYNRWYDDVNNTFFDRKHIIEKLKIDKVNQNEYKIEMDIYFRAKTWKKGQAKSRNIHVKGNIEWTLIRDKVTKDFKIKKYHIYENQV